MNTTKPTQIHTFRRRLRQVEQARAEHIETLLKAGPMIEGSFVTLWCKCGRATCHCATGGQKHPKQYISRSERGRTKTTYVRKADHEDVEAKTACYRQYRQARAELMKLAADTAALADQLMAELTKPYPPTDSPQQVDGSQDDD
jgi:hypothetical protein